MLYNWCKVFNVKWIATMIIDGKSVSKKDQIINSMAKKLADVSAVDDLERIKKKRVKKTNRVYIIAVMIFVCLSVTVYTIEKTRREEKLQQVTMVSLVNQDSPLKRLTDALKDESVTVDQYAMFLSDLLIRYDSIPERFKTDRPVILNEEVYRSLMGVWMQLQHQTRNKLAKNLPALRPRIEKLLDSLRIR
jgi:hypothetical protein